MNKKTFKDLEMELLNANKRFLEIRELARSAGKYADQKEKERDEALEAYHKIASKFHDVQQEMEEIVYQIKAKQTELFHALLSEEAFELFSEYCDE